MTIREEIEFAQGQIEWHTRQNKWCEEQIQWCSEQLIRTRREDKELREFALSRTDADPAIWEKYVGNETKKLLSERRKHQREIKNNEVWIAKFQKRIDDLNRDREIYGE